MMTISELNLTDAMVAGLAAAARGPLIRWPGGRWAPWTTACTFGAVFPALPVDSLSATTLRALEARGFVAPDERLNLRGCIPGKWGREWEHGLPRVITPKGREVHQMIEQHRRRRRLLDRFVKMPEADKHFVRQLVQRGRDMDEAIEIAIGDRPEFEGAVNAA